MARAGSILDFSTAMERYPLLYWVTFLYLLGIPNFVHFDETGRTANSINFTSISTIILSVVAGYLFVAMLLLDRQPLMVRKIEVKMWVWTSLFLELLLATVLEPHARLTVSTTTSLFLALFRMGQWFIAFCLTVALYSRTPRQQATDMIIGLIGRISWAWILMVWFFLPVLPSQVYGVADDAGSEAVRRLGGQLINPANLAVFSATAFFYALLFCERGPKRWAAWLVALPTLFLTGSRAQEGGFILALLLYAFLFTRNALIRWGTLFFGALGGLMSLFFSDKVGKYIGRGQSLQTLSTLDDRTRIWQACIEAIRAHPLFGYGYSIGARNAIRDHWKFAHWIPPHAHNEFLEAALDGGLIAMGLMILIYCLVLWKSLRGVRTGLRGQFLFLIFLQVALTAMTGGPFTYKYGGSSAVALLCCIGILGRQQPRLRARRASSMVNAGEIHAPRMTMAT